MSEKIILKEGMRAGVLGFARAGQAVCRYLASRNISVLVSDQRTKQELSSQYQQVLAETRAYYQGGEQSAEFFKGCNFVVISPGVDPGQQLVRDIKALSIPVYGELVLAAGQFEVPVIAVTGTNGKTTVTELIGALLKAGEQSVFVGGNIGRPLFEFFLDRADYKAVVLEISSYQLENCGTFMADIAVLLNITADHLDRHGTMEQYAREKMKIFGNEEQQGQAVINGDDRLTDLYLNLADRTQFSRFGSAPDAQAVIGEESVVIKERNGEQIYDLSDCDLGSVTGRQNSAAALLAVKPFGLNADALRQALRSFKTGPHRLELVDTIKGVKYINDSKATNTGAVKSGLAQFDSGVILIAGGSDKGDDFRLLRDSVGRCVKQLLLIGSSAERLVEALADIVTVSRANSLEDAVRQAASLADEDDVVLLSPACASFDMFDSYIHRGEVFRSIVHQLANAEHVT
ncbi:MAG: UDP-N-acetylmuramoyl-L-alanine--D-glutamate ligase [Desulfobulbaceae bacterium]|nr:MAG: UDP-N-acetylmuramoyl-L-alanine--D-glutamate ligase [Desulfobulbaceae bacterium]